MEYKILYTLMVVISFLLTISAIKTINEKYKNDSWQSNLLAYILALFLANGFIFAVGSLIIWIWSV